MGNTREDLQDFLEALPGSPHVYFQPPESMKLKYPAIIYSRASIDIKHAENKVYKRGFKYNITVVDFDPDSALVLEVSKIPRIRYSRPYIANNLYHDVFELNW